MVVVAAVAAVQHMFTLSGVALGPEGVRGRNSENSLFERDLGFRPHFDLKKGIEKTYLWISEQVKNA